ncbi:MAG: UvrD-helicase domain-containing protein [Vicinamibacterales bacterium]
MHFLDTLNPEQRDAVLHVNGPLLILAGAGSGKTKVITSRIAYLVGDGHARPNEILAVTFTNKAAEEMRTRVETLLGEDCSRMWVSTFHSLCARLLRREAPAIGLSRDFVIYDSSDQLTVVKQALKELQIDDSFVQPRAALSRISHAKNRMETPEQMAASAGWNRRDENIAKIYAKYIAALKEASALDFDDLLLKTVDIFEQSAVVRQRYAEQFRFVMVDEYQDTNRPQYLLIQRLSEVYRNLCVVGDPDQSIYKWRGADLKNILDFEHDYPEAKTVKLERNYRSTQVILDAASAVISQNRNRKDKRLWTDQKGGARIVYFRGGDELEEADFITRTARGGLADDPESMVAILYRTNAQSRAIEDALMREGLAYRIIGGVRFYERKEIKDALAYMRLVINPHDDVSLRRVINTPTRGIGKGVMDAVEKIAITNLPDDDFPLLSAGLAPVPTANSLWARVVHGLGEKAFTGRAASALTTFRDLIVKLTDDRTAGSGVRHDRQDPRPKWISRRPARGTFRGSGSSYREPGGARVRRARVRRAGSGTEPDRIRRSAVAAVRRRRRSRNARRQDLDDDAAQRQGARVPDGDPRRARRGTVSSREVGGGRRGARGGTAALLCGHDARAQAPRAHGCGAPARVRRIPVE